MSTPSNTKYAKIQICTRTQSEWQIKNPVLLTGEVGLESDTLRMKIGNGNDRYSDLKYTDAEIRERLSALEEFAKAQAELISSAITNYERYS